jgi:hypothetical protein
MNRRQMIKNLGVGLGAALIPFKLFGWSQEDKCPYWEIYDKDLNLIKFKYVPFKYRGKPIKTDYVFEGENVHCPPFDKRIFKDIKQQIRNVYRSCRKENYPDPHITVFIDEKSHQCGIMGISGRFLKEAA